MLHKANGMEELGLPARSAVRLGESWQLGLPARRALRLGESWELGLPLGELYASESELGAGPPARRELEVSNY